MSFPGVTQYPQRAKRERKISKRITMSGLSVTRTSLRIWKEETTHHEDVLSLKQCIWHLLLGTHKQNQCHAFSVHPPLTIASDDRNVVQLLISDAIAVRSNVVRYLHHKMLLRCTAIEMRCGNQRTSENLSPSHQVIELHRCLHFCKALCRRAESDAGTLVFFFFFTADATGWCAAAPLCKVTQGLPGWTTSSPSWQLRWHTCCSTVNIGASVLEHTMSFNLVASHYIAQVGVKEQHATP